MQQNNEKEKKAAIFDGDGLVFSFFAATLLKLSYSVFKSDFDNIEFEVELVVYAAILWLISWKKKQLFWVVTGGLLPFSRPQFSD